MRNVGFAVSSVSGGFLVFALLCSPVVSVPLYVLLLFLLGLQAGLVWMIITVLKHGKSSGSTFEEKWYEDMPGK